MQSEASNPVDTMEPAMPVEEDQLFFTQDQDGELFSGHNMNEDAVYDQMAPKDQHAMTLNRRPKKSVKKQINRGVIDIDRLDVTFEKFPHLSSSQDITLDQLKEITRNLAIIPHNLVDIAHSDVKDRHPVILRLYPLNYEVHNNAKYSSGKWVVTPFPTLFWCYCPVIHDKVSNLEENGGVQLLQERLLSKPEYIELMDQAHRLYAQERFSLLTEKDLEYVTKQQWLNPVKEVGIAGIRNFATVKCLHCHYAHYLARPEHKNIIGQWVHEMLIEKGLISV